MPDPADIIALHASLSEATLEALANKGLLRRAHKDIERGGIHVQDHTTAENPVVQVDDHSVHLHADGPAKATCSCPAPGICQHILAACLYLMRHAVAPASAAADAPPETERKADSSDQVRQQWLKLTDDDLLTHYSLPTLRLAHALLQQHTPTLPNADTLVVFFPTLNANVRGLPNTGLAGNVVTGASSKRHDEISAAAVLHVRSQAGMAWQPPIKRGQSYSALPPSEVLLSVREHLLHTLSTGLTRLSPSSTPLFESLSISAQTSGMQRLALLLQNLATEVQEWLNRQPHADLANLFANMARAYAVTEALLATSPPKDHLLGQAREVYHEVGNLQLHGIAGWPWRTRSGYEGLTVLFWDSQGNQWCTWSDARPRSFQGIFSALARWQQPSPWDGAQSPAQLATHSFRLSRARRNRWGRLSSATQTNALVIAPTNSTQLDLPITTDWDKLHSQLAGEHLPGLREQDPRHAYQVIQPAVWQLLPFDAVAQCLQWYLLDTKGRAILLRVPYDDLHRPLITNLEKLQLADLEGALLVCRCHLEQQCPVALPLSLIQPKKNQSTTLTSLCFSSAASSNPTTAAQVIPLPPAAADEDMNTEEDEPDMDSSPSTQPSAIQRFALQLTSALEVMAERGQSARLGIGDTLLLPQARALGLQKLMPLLESLAHSYQPATLLRLRWITTLIQQAK